MKELLDRLEKFSEFDNPCSYIKSEYVDFEEVYYHYLQYYNNIENSFFDNFWNSDLEKYLIQLIDCLGYHWKYYVFDLFNSVFQKYEIEYFTDKFIAESSKTIKEYFKNNPKEIFYPNFEKYPKNWKTVFRNLPPSPELVSEYFYNDLSDYLTSKGIKLIFDKKVSIRVRTRRSKATGEIFSDVKNCGDIELQNFKIYYSYTDFDIFKRIGSDENVKESIKELRKLFDFLKFIPKENATCKSIYKDIGIEKYATFVNIAKNCYWPSRYSGVYGNWMSAIKETGFLGDNPIIKGFYGYRVLAKDGHVCNSLAEKIIDDFFFDNLIEHEKEPAYPENIKRFVGKKIRADWKIKDYFVEYFGLQTNPEYAKKTDVKIMACDLFNVKLIKLFPGDENHLETIFKEFISV